MAINQFELDRHNELAAFLRSRRARILPEQVGLPNGMRRRTPGLRRGEVAQLAGVSSEWYTWLEQGRDINVSVQVLESLAKALRLDSDERAHLFLLASRQPPPVETFSPPTVSPTMQSFLDLLGTTPACAVDARLNIVAWNQVHELIFGNCVPVSEYSRNLIWRLFTPTARSCNEEWKALARIYLAQFRSGYGRYINDPWWNKLIAELNQNSPEFRELWPQQDVQNISEGCKTRHHPRVGNLYFNFLWLQTIESRDLLVLIHTPRPGTPTADRIAQLLAEKGEFDTQTAQAF